MKRLLIKMTLMKALGLNLMQSVQYWQNCNQNTTADLNENP